MKSNLAYVDFKHHKILTKRQYIRYLQKNEVGKKVEIKSLTYLDTFFRSPLEINKLYLEQFNLSLNEITKNIKKTNNYLESIIKFTNPFLFYNQYFLEKMPKAANNSKFELETRKKLELLISN